MSIRLHVHTSFGQPPPPWFKGRQDDRRDPGEVTAWCWHQTDVAGGFGAADLEARCIRYEGTQEQSDKEIEKGEDGKVGVPYHYVYSPQDAAVIALWHPEFYSYHGDGSNSFSIGIVIDGKYPGDDLDTVALAEAFEVAIEHAAGLGWSPDNLDAHRQHSAGRGGDPGDEVWPVVETVALEYSIAPTITRTTGSGQPIPDSWRPDGTEPNPPLTAGIFAPVDIPAMPSGMFSHAVLIVQHLCASQGFDPGPLDGKPGSKTEAAVEEFQIARSLPGTAVVDYATWCWLVAPE